MTIYGEVPSKKNTRIPVTRGSYTFMIPGKTYKAWHALAVPQVPKCRVESPTAVTMTFYAKTKRKADLTNRAESVMDLLVDCGVLEDDNYFAVPKVTLVFAGVDKEQPRVEIDFTAI